MAGSSSSCLSKPGDERRVLVASCRGRADPFAAIWEPEATCRKPPIVHGLKYRLRLSPGAGTSLRVQAAADTTPICSDAVGHCSLVLLRTVRDAFCANGSMSAMPRSGGLPPDRSPDGRWQHNAVKLITERTAELPLASSGKRPQAIIVRIVAACLGDQRPHVDRAAAAAIEEAQSLVPHCASRLAERQP